MKQLTLICTIWLIANCPAWAGDQQKRFVEFPSIDTLTYDLDTVQIIAPGRFAIMSTTIDNPDVMKFELNALEILEHYCARTDGKYPAPSDLFQFGQPDHLPVEQIEVKTMHRRLVNTFTGNTPIGNSKQFSTLHYSANGPVTGATPSPMGFGKKNVYDCKRGLVSLGADEGDDPRDAYMMPVKNGTNGAFWYSMICRAVTHEERYLPE
jgi:hypothetical protein